MTKSAKIVLPTRPRRSQSRETGGRDTHVEDRPDRRDRRSPGLPGRRRISVYHLDRKSPAAPPATATATARPVTARTPSTSFRREATNSLCRIGWLTDEVERGRDQEHYEPSHPEAPGQRLARLCRHPGGCPARSCRVIRPEGCYQAWHQCAPFRSAIPPSQGCVIRPDRTQ
jgi:hypothetical protein